jgi:outer membrane lipoprotein LolB
VVRPYRDEIDLSGRLSVRYQNNGQEEALHGSFVWNQNPARTSITLLSPLGQTMAIIDVTRDGATLSQAGQPVRMAADADALAAGTLGWPLPVAGLRDWLQGYAVDANGSRFIASPQTTDVATRDGWRIRYAGWQDDSPPNRPKRIDLERSTAQAGDVSIRIVIDKWQ